MKKQKTNETKSILNPDFWYKHIAKKDNIVTEFDIPKKGEKPFDRENNKKN